MIPKQEQSGALGVLAARIKDKQIQEQRENGGDPKSRSGSGDRSERIRT